MYVSIHALVDRVGARVRCLRYLISWVRPLAGGLLSLQWKNIVAPFPPCPAWPSIHPMPYPVPRVRPQMRLTLPPNPAGSFIARLGKFEPRSGASGCPRQMK